MLAALCSVAVLTGCSDSNDAAEDKLEQAASASAAAAGPAQVALGLNEAQLLSADLIGADGVELGDVAQVLRDGSGTVDRLLIEVEDNNPDRYVQIPIAGLKTVVRGTETDLSTTMTKQQLGALPAVKLPAP